MLQFFDTELISAIQQREQNYVTRMTAAFRGELERQLHDTAQHLTHARAQLAQQDKQMDFMRSQIDRRRLELETQRIKFIHEILGMREKNLSNAALQDMLTKAFKNEPKEILHSGRRSGLHESMGDTHLTKASDKAKSKAQSQLLMKLRDRARSLQEQLEGQQAFADSVREQRDHWEKVAKDLSKGEATQEQAVKKMQLGMKFASNARLQAARKKQTWWSGIDTSSSMLIKLQYTINHLTPETDARTFESLLNLFGSNQVQDFFLPRLFQMRARQKIIDHEQGRGVVTRHMTKQEEEMVQWMHNIKETAAMVMVESKINRGDLGLNSKVVSTATASNEAAAVAAAGGGGGGGGGLEVTPTTTPSPTPTAPLKTIFCHVMDNAGTDVLCPWCTGHGSVTEDMAVVSAEIESEQLAERLRTQLERVKTALHMAGRKIKQLSQKPKRRHVNVQVDSDSIAKECGGADAEHHADNEKEEDREAHRQESEQLMEQAAQAIAAIKQLKIIKKEKIELKRTLATQEKHLKKKIKDFSTLQEDHVELTNDLSRMAEELKNKNSKIEFMKHSGGSNGGSNERLLQELETLRTIVQNKKVEDATNGLQNVDFSTNNSQNEIRAHQEHASAVGKRLKNADHEIHQLKAEILLKDVELGKRNREVEEAMKMLAKHAGTFGKRRIVSTQTEGDWSNMNVPVNHKENNENDMNELDRVAIERGKTWNWLTQTHREMASQPGYNGPETTEAETETETETAIDTNPTSPTKTTVRDALEARKWLVSKQACMNWAVLTQTMLNIIEVNQDKKYQQTLRLKWLHSTKQNTEDARRKTTEKIMNGVMKQLLMGGKDLATYLPNGAFQPYIKNFIKYKYRSNNRSSKRKRRKRNSGDQKEDENIENGKQDKQGNSNENNYHRWVPELGSFPQRRTLFSHGSHRVTRIPLSNSSPKGLATNDKWQSSDHIGNNSNGKKYILRKKKTSPGRRPARPATARRSRQYQPVKESSSKGVPRRPKSAVNRGWQPPPKWS